MGVNVTAMIQRENRKLILSIVDEKTPIKKEQTDNLYSISDGESKILMYTDRPVFIQNFVGLLKEGKFNINLVKFM